MQYNAIPCNTIQYNPIPWNSMQYHASLLTADVAYHCPVGSIWLFLIYLSWPGHLYIKWGTEPWGKRDALFRPRWMLLYSSTCPCVHLCSCDLLDEDFLLDKNRMLSTITHSGWFLNGPPLFSTKMKKTPRPNQRLFYERIHGRAALVGSKAFNNFGTERGGI